MECLLLSDGEASMSYVAFILDIKVPIKKKKQHTRSYFSIVLIKQSYLKCFLEKTIRKGPESSHYD